MSGNELNPDETDTEIITTDGDTINSNNNNNSNNMDSVAPDKVDIDADQREKINHIRDMIHNQQEQQSQETPTKIAPKDEEIIIKTDINTAQEVSEKMIESSNAPNKTQNSEINAAVPAANAVENAAVQPHSAETKDNAAENPKIVDKNENNDTMDLETVEINQTRTAEITVQKEIQDLINPTDTSKKPSSTEDTAAGGGGSSKKKCIDKSGNYIVYGLIISLFVFLAINIIINITNGTIDDSGDELGVIIGLTVTNMILTPVLLHTVGYYGFILTITECSAIYILFLTLFILIIDFIYFAVYLDDYAAIYIIYVVIKIVLLWQFFIFGQIDVKHYGSNVIQYYLKDKTFMSSDSVAGGSQLNRLYFPWMVIIIFIQMVLFILGCLAFVGGLDELIELKIIVFLLLIWSIKSLTHALHFIAARVATYAIDEKSKLNIRTNNSKLAQRMRSVSQVRIKTEKKSKETDTATTTTVAGAKIETIEHAEDGTNGKINASSTEIAAASIEIENKDNKDNKNDDAINNTDTVAVPVNGNTAENTEITTNDTNDTNDTNNVAGTVQTTTTTQVVTNTATTKNNESVMAAVIAGGVYEITEESKASADDIEEFDPINAAFDEAGYKVASIVIGSGLVTFSGIPNLLANLAQASKIVARCLAVGCACCAEVSEDGKGDGGNACWCFALIAQIYSGVAWLLEKIAKFLLQFVHKMILTSSAFRNISYCDALGEMKRMLEETKDTFASKMVLLDNALAQHVTHLILLCSSLGAWMAIWFGYGEYAPLIHISGYLAGRSAFEVIEVVLQLWLVIWHLDPMLLGVNEPIYKIIEIRKKEYEYELNGEKKTREQIVYEVEKEIQVTKLTSGATQSVAIEKETVVMDLQTAEAVAVR